MTLCRAALLPLATSLLLLCFAALLWHQPVLALTPPEPDPAPIACPATPTDGAAVNRLAQLLRFKTVSNPDRPHNLEDPAEFDAMLSFFADAYAPLWAHLEVEQVGSGGYSRMLTWRGTDASLLPVLFISHYDVVPVDAPEEWTHPPFSGDVVDGYIWGRGALDIKYGVAGLLEAASDMLACGYQPQRTIIFSFGQDEECGGEGGQAAAALLAQRGIRVEIALDEGGAVYWDGYSPLTTHPVALVGTAEKGFDQMDVEFHSAGGHSSMPPLDRSDIAGQVSRFVTYLSVKPMPAVLMEPLVGMFQALGEVTHRWWLRLLLARADTWPVNWLIAQTLAYKDGRSAATVRTTVATTFLRAGIARNVLPQHGTISINLRLMQGTTQADVLSYLRGAVNATGVNATVEPTPGSQRNDASRVTSAAGPHFQILKRTIQELWQSMGKAVTVVPNLVTGMTDSRHFADLSEHGILRFVPVASNITAGDRQGVHGTNERAPVSSYLRAICTYRLLIERYSAGGAIV